MLRHHVLTGEREVTIDGQVIDHHKPAVAEAMRQPTKRYDFDVDGVAGACVVEITKTFWGGFRYSCTYKGKVLESKTAEGGEGGVEFMLEVTNAEFGEDRKTVYYTTRLSRPERDPLERRHTYAEFAAMDKKVRSHFRDMHKVKDLPVCPGRSFLKKGTSFHFIQERARKLDVYLNRLALVYGISDSPDFLEFVGVDPKTWFQEVYEDAHRAVLM